MGCCDDLQGALEERMSGPPRPNDPVPTHVAVKHSPVPGHREYMARQKETVQYRAKLGGRT